VALRGRQARPVQPQDHPRRAPWLVERNTVALFKNAVLSSAGLESAAGLHRAGTLQARIEAETAATIARTMCWEPPCATSTGQRHRPEELIGELEPVVRAALRLPPEDQSRRQPSPTPP
jgi:hypothetical protein